MINHEVESDIELLKDDYLRKFIEQYEYNYTKTSNSGVKLATLLQNNSNIAKNKNKNTKAAQKLLDNWLANGSNGLGEEKLSILLSCMGFAVCEVNKQPKIAGKIENYNIYLQKPENGRKISLKHPIAAFGSKAIDSGFRVVCLYGSYTADGLIETCKEIGNAKHTIILLDYALSHPERRKLARITKKEVPEKIFGVIDRVLLMYLVNNYEETSINRMLMAVMMPYTFYQPYVVESSHTMPPEIFIGRKNELAKIESPTGVNIVYGGRQLGKSALLRKAKEEVNENENGDRAVYVDIKG
jgi:hypothetical protein